LINLNKTDVIKIFGVVALFYPVLILTGPFLPDLFIVASIFLIFLSKLQLNLKFIFKNYYLIFLFWILCVISSILSEQIYFSFKSSFFYIRFFLYSCFIWYLLREKYLNLKSLIYLMYIVYLFLIFDSHFQYIFNFNVFGMITESKMRISSIFGSELIMGSFLLRTFPVFIALLLAYNKDNLLLIIPLIYSSIILSGERTTIFLSIIFLLVLLKIEISNKKKIVNFFLIIIVFLSHFFFNENFNYNLTDRMKEEVTFNIDIKKNIDNEGEYKKVLPFKIFTDNHTRIYNTSYLMFLDNKIFGQGANNFRKKCFNYDPKACTTHPHNHLFQILSEVGLLGFFLYLVIFITILKKLFKEFFDKRKLSCVRFILLLSIVINFFPFLPSGNFFNNYLNIMMYFPVGFYLYYGNINREQK